MLLNFSALSLQQLWSMIESMQIVLLLPLINVDFPPLPQKLFAIFQQFFNFQLFDTSMISNLFLPAGLQTPSPNVDPNAADD